jgi:hypothetical protein
MSDPRPPADPAPSDALVPGRTAPLDRNDADRLFRQGVALFNGVRYWHAHEAWETLWHAAPDEERNFYQGLIQVAAGLLHVQRKNLRGARNKLSEGMDKLRPYLPAHHGIFINELMGEVRRILDDLDAGQVPYLIPPIIRFTETHEPDWSR